MKLEMKNIYKSFGNNKVLEGVNFSLEEGEIHALVGENGAGKSTLMNILSGILPMDSGQIFIDGKTVEINSSFDAKKFGIGFIHQELVDRPDLTVMENLFMNKEIKNGLFLDYKKMRERTEEVFSLLDIDINPDSLVRDMSVGQRQMMEIAKANMEDLQILILDEPTTALTNKEIDKLFRLIKKLRDKKVSMIYISHRMEEIFALTKKITVMRDGKSVACLDTNKTNEAEVVKYMVGRDIGDFYPQINRTPGEIKLEIRDFTHEPFFRDINISARKGEVVGIGGLMGAGRSEIFRSLFALEPKDSGKIFIDGKEVLIKSPSEAISKGMAFITENRKEEGLVSDQSIRENISLANLNKISSKGILNKKRERDLAEKYRQDLNIRSESIENKAEDLSGGNQQKVVMAKRFETSPQILILDEPTKGVDVGAKREIYDLINEMPERGVAVILISSDLPELLSLSDRIYIIYEGRLQGEIGREKASQENVMTLATGGRI